MCAADEPLVLLRWLAATCMISGMHLTSPVAALAGMQEGGGDGDGGGGPAVRSDQAIVCLLVMTY